MMGKGQKSSVRRGELQLKDVVDGSDMQSRTHLRLAFGGAFVVSPSLSSSFPHPSRFPLRDMKRWEDGNMISHNHTPNPVIFSC